MIRLGFVSLLTACALIFPGATWAGPAYTPGDIVAFFSKEMPLGKTRGLCVGTESSCSAPGGAAPKGFDMLVSFDLDSAVLTPAAKDNLDQFALALKDDRLAAARFVVEGHSDARGGARHNMTLSEARARSVREFLLGKGIAADKLQVVGLGETQPRVPDPFDPENRRVEMKLRLP